MKNRSRLIGSNILTFLALTVGGIIGTAFRSPLEDRIKEMVVSYLQDALMFAVSPVLWRATFDTLLAFLLTGGATIIAGLLLAWLIYSSRFAALVLEPIIQFLKPIPSIATISIGAIILSATSGFLGILVAFLGSLWPFTVAVLNAFREVPKALRESTLSLGKSEKVFYRQVLFFGALPGLFNAVRLVAPITLLLTVTTQYFYQNLGGLGALLFDKHSGIKYPEVICIVAMLSLTGFGIEYLVNQIEQKTCKWRIDRTADHE